ncbi:MAG: type II secretion system protein [Candidatus Margulisiibacteriota bacterium]
MNRQQNNNRGFTLLEILFVLAVIWIIAGVILPSFRGFENEANISRAESNINVIKMAVESYRRYHSGGLPNNITTDLIYASPRVIVEVFSDPWKTAVSELAKTGYTYGYMTGYVNGFGNIYAIYTVGIDKAGTVTWDTTALANVVVSINNNAIVASNAPVR